MNTTKRISRAFTLMELMVAIAIIGVLSALILSALSGATKLSRRATCAHNVRQQDLAMQEFVQQNHVYPQDSETDLNRELGGADDSLLPKWENGKWIWETGIWKCPSAVRPATWPTNQGYSSYGYNTCGFLGKGTFPNANVTWDAHGLAGQSGPWPGRYPPVLESEVAAPSEMIALGDGFMGNENFVEGGALIRVSDPPRFIWDKKEPWVRHQGKADIAFCDGHVEALTLKSLFQDTSDEALSRWNRDHQPHRELLN
jgi:prepilin-type N-terminal cleavage/methylation domain-containing protein/prepilin-type processing-associated H-X9-DG protein